MSLTYEEKKIVIETLGYTIDKGGIVCKENGESIICPFTNKPVKFEEASIMPNGSLVIMNTTPLTLSEYFYQHPDD